MIVVALALLGGAWLWLRQSSLVAVKRVDVVGVSGPDASQIRSALVSAADTMTTLNVQMSHLRTAVSLYPVVKHLLVSTQFPHGMRIQVIEQVPVALVEVDGRRTAVAGDGTLLRDAGTGAPLPTITLAVAPGGTHLTGAARSEVAMLAAAPYQLLAKVAQVSSDPTHGLVAQLRNGPRVYFGSGAQLMAKWDAVTEVLADAHSAGADYIDVTVPARPAAGTGTDGAPTSSAGAGTTAGTPTTAATSTTAGTATTAAAPATAGTATASGTPSMAGTATAGVTPSTVGTATTAGTATTG
ncbi:MAG: cell division protein FtsQ/DivIB [Solirubrobacteraceae bacterium]